MKDLIAILVAIAAVPLNGLALAKLWLWFIVPVFHAPSLSAAQAIGIAMTVSFITSQYAGKDDREAWEAAVAALIKPLVAVSIGWVVTWFL